MFAGSNNKKKTTKIQAEKTCKLGINNPIPNKISNIPVRNTNSTFKGMMGGIIIVIPFVKAKCPMAVKHSIAHIANLAERGKSYFWVSNFIIKIATVNVDIKTIKGFIAFILR